MPQNHGWNECKIDKKIDMRENLYHVIQDCVVFSNTILVTQDVRFCLKAH